MPSARDSLHSTQRELLIEHLFVGELLKRTWLRNLPNLEVSKPQADNGGYDLVLEAGKFIRHVQLKSSQRESSARNVNVNVALSTKASGCVIWIRFDARSLDLGPFLWFGGVPGQPLPSLSSCRVARHTKGDAKGFKAQRPNVRVVTKSLFTPLLAIDDVIDRLFGFGQ